MRRLVLLLLSLTVISCDNLSSSFDTPDPIQPEIQEKPKNCPINFQKTCWPDTVNEITLCLQENKGQDKFSADKRHCFNDSGKFIEFHNAAQLFNNPFNPTSSYFFFTFSSDQVNDCFQVEGSGGDLTIRVKGYEDTPVRIIRNGQVYSFSCLDGQQVFVNDPQKVNDCEAKNGPQSIPGVYFGPFHQNGAVSGWSFNFTGANEHPEDIFRCHY